MDVLVKNQNVPKANLKIKKRKEKKETKANLNPAGWVLVTCVCELIWERHIYLYVCVCVIVYLRLTPFNSVQTPCHQLTTTLCWLHGLLFAPHYLSRFMPGRFMHGIRLRAHKKQKNTKKKKKKRSCRVWFIIDSAFFFLNFKSDKN